MELLDERWTLLVVRELMMGSRHFNELRRGVPRMSPTLLSKRLHTLLRAGIAERRAEDGEVLYRLTPAGEELRPIVEALGAWGTRWMGELGDEDLDPKLLLWDMHRDVDHDAVPSSGAVVRSGALAVDAPTDTRRALPNWFTLSVFARVPRPRARSRPEGQSEAQDDTSLVPSRAHANAPNTTT